MIEFYKEEALNQWKSIQKKTKMMYILVIFVLIGFHVLISWIFKDQKFIFLIFQMVLDLIVLGSVLYHYDQIYDVIKKKIRFFSLIEHKNKEILQGVILETSSQPVNYQGLLCNEVILRFEDFTKRKLMIENTHHHMIQVGLRIEVVCKDAFILSLKEIVS